MSTHEVNIISIEAIDPHPEAERLELVRIGQWTCIAKKGEFRSGDRAIHVEPDYCVPVDHPLFSFLKDEKKLYDHRARIRVRKLRGIYSEGLLVPVPEEFAHLPVGTNLAEELRIVRYVPRPTVNDVDRPRFNGFHELPPALFSPVYDLENVQKYHALFTVGEPVVITEKLHGTGFRAVFTRNRDGQDEIFIGSRRNWMRSGGTDVYWKAANHYPGIFDLCRQHRDTIFYGEVFGWVQDLHYGAMPGEVYLALFAAFRLGQWFSIFDNHRITIPRDFGVPIVPIVEDGSFSLDHVRSVSMGQSLWPGANHIREGVVVTPIVERHDAPIGRIALKCINNAYLERG